MQLLLYLLGRKLSPKQRKDMYILLLVVLSIGALAIIGLVIWAKLATGR